MKLTTGSSNGWKKFVPEFSDNKKSKPEEQMSVEVHWLSHGEKKRYASRVRLEAKGRKLADNSADIDRQIFVDNVKNIKNLFIDGIQVTDPGELYDKAPDELIDEIVDVINKYGELDEDDVKN